MCVDCNLVLYLPNWGDGDSFLCRPIVAAWSNDTTV